MSSASSMIVPSGLAILSNFVALIAFIAVVPPVARRRRPDAVPILLCTLVNGLGFAVRHVGARGLFIWGIVHLARPGEHA